MCAFSIPMPNYIPQLNPRSLFQTTRAREEMSKQPTCKGCQTCFLRSISRLIFSTAGGMGKSTSIVYERLAHLLSLKREESYSNVIRWLRCRLGFALVRAQIMCLRRCRSLCSHSDIDCPASIAQCVPEGCIPQSRTFINIYHHQFTWCNVTNRQHTQN